MVESLHFVGQVFSRLTPHCHGLIFGQHPWSFRLYTFGLPAKLLLFSSFTCDKLMATATWEELITACGRPRMKNGIATRYQGGLAEG